MGDCGVRGSGFRGWEFRRRERQGFGKFRVQGLEHSEPEVYGLTHFRGSAN